MRVHMPVRLCTDRESHAARMIVLVRGVIGPLLKRLAYICPSLRNVSMPRPSSCARPLRSAIVVIRSSEMI